MICNARFHRGCDSQRLMHPAEIVIRMIDRNHVAVILKLFGEPIGEPREATNAHPQVEVCRST